MSVTVHDRRSSATAWPSRMAGGLLVLLGLTNAVLGLLGLATDVVRLAPGPAGGLLAVGVLTASLGVLVWRGSRAAVVTALTVFGLLLVVQVGDVAAGGRPSTPGVTDAAGARIGVLAVVVAALTLAQVRGRRRR